jgi:hypothetical protein
MILTLHPSFRFGLGFGVSETQPYPYGYWGGGGLGLASIRGGPAQVGPETASVYRRNCACSSPKGGATIPESPVGRAR